MSTGLDDHCGKPPYAQSAGVLCRGLLASCTSYHCSPQSLFTVHAPRKPSFSSTSLNMDCQQMWALGFKEEKCAPSSEWPHTSRSSEAANTVLPCKVARLPKCCSDSSFNPLKYAFVAHASELRPEVELLKPRAVEFDLFRRSCLQQ